MITVSGLITLIPVTLLLHCIEEWFFGFPEWATRRFGTITTRKFYLVSHVPIFAIFISFSLRVFTNGFAESFLFLTLIAQIVLFTNGIFHLISSILFREYSPGVVTALVCYFPFSGLLYFRLLTGDFLTLQQFLWAMGLGSIISCFVVYSLTWKKII